MNILRIRICVCLAVALALVGVLGLPAVGEDSPLVSASFYETDLREALNELAHSAQVNIIADYTVQGPVTMTFENIRLEKALDMLLAGGGYAYRKIDDYYLVGVIDERAPSYAVLAAGEVLRLKYARAEDLVKNLSSAYAGTVKADVNQNAIVFMGSATMLKRLREEIARLDVRPLQVMLEALVVEVSDSGGLNFGLESGGHELTSLDLAEGVIKYSLVNLPSQFYAKLQAMVKEGKANVKANPRIVALHGKEAMIFSGVAKYFNLVVPVNGVADYNYARLENIRVGVTLKMTPWVGESGEIMLDIRPEVSNVVGLNPQGLPELNTRSAQTTVMVKDGQTVVLGGLSYEEDVKQANRVPLLGKLPVLGWLFSYSKSSKSKSQLYIFVTPRLAKE